MKRNRKWLFIAALFVLALPMLFTANAEASVGDKICLLCHDTIGSGLAYLDTGHANAAREYTGPTLLDRVEIL